MKKWGIKTNNLHLGYLNIHMSPLFLPLQQQSFQWGDCYALTKNLHLGYLKNKHCFMLIV